VPRGALELGEATPLKKARNPQAVSLGGLAPAVKYEGMTVIEVDSLSQALQVAFTAP
jgi:DNA repair protein RadA/Sms